jgi:hypothetical protein
MSGRWVSLRPSQERETRRVFGEWLSHIGRDARPNTRLDSLPPLGGRCPCSHALNASRTTSPLQVSASSRIWSAPFAELATSSAWPRPSRAFSLVKTRRFAMRALSLLGNPSLSRSAPAASTTIRKVSGSPRYPLPMAAMTNTGPLAGTRALHVEHVFAAIGALSQAAFRVVAHSAVDASD